MHSDSGEQEMQEHYEISNRFRRLIQLRIDRLETAAALDEAAVKLLENSDHVRRHMRLVCAEREEAARMRRFLERSGTRMPRPTPAL